MGLEELKQWSEINIAPNVKKIHAYKRLPDDGAIARYDVSVLISKANGASEIRTQSVYEYDGNFDLGREIVKNHVDEPTQESVEKELIRYLDNKFGENGYDICSPIDTSSGKAAVIAVKDQKFVLAKIDSQIVMKTFKE